MPLTMLAENHGTSIAMIQKITRSDRGKRREVIEATAPKLRRVK